MTPTPPLPTWIRDYRTASYRSVYEDGFCPNETRLFGTESLHGDWSGELLLLAKDFAPAKLLRDRIAAGELRPYEHTNWRVDPNGPGARTNRNLFSLAQDIPCGKLYGSALACLLRDDDQLSGTLPDRRAISAFVGAILNFTIAHMPNLRAVACLGVDAWGFATEALGCPGEDWTTYRNHHRVLRARPLRLFALPHPSRPCGGGKQVRSDWDWLRVSLQCRKRRRNPILAANYEDPGFIDEGLS